MKIHQHLIALSLGVALPFAGPLSAKPDTSGPFPPEIAAWTEETKESQRIAGSEMVATIEEKVAAGEKNIVIPKGHYRFAEGTGDRYPAHIFLPSDMDGVTIDFQGSTLWFETESSGVVLSGAKNTTIRNVFLDWDPLPFMQGTIAAINATAGTLDIKLDPGYENVVPAMRDTSWRGRGIAFDRTTRELKSGQHGCSVTFSWDKRQDDGSYRVQFHGFHDVALADAGFEVGDPFVMYKRGGGGISMQRAFRLSGSVDCTLEDVTLYASPFVAFVNTSGGGTTFRRCNILRRPDTNRLIAGNADGINCDNMTKGPLIEDCRMETLGDDFVNVHGHLGRVIWQDAPDEIITTVLNRRSEMSTPVTVEFLERATMRSLGKRQATWTVTRQEIDPERCLADLKHKWHSGAASALSTANIGKTIPAVRLKLDEPIEIDGDIIVLCEALSSSGAIIRNNEFKGSLARGLRLQSPNVVVENNVIAITRGPALTLFGHASFWGEGPYVHSAVVRNNTFSDNGIGEAQRGQRAALIIQESDDQQVRITRDIRIEDNTFERSAGPAIVARGVTNLAIIGNRVEGYAERAPFPMQPMPRGMEAAIVLESISGLTLENNTIEQPGPYAQGDPVLQIDIEP